MGSDGICHGDAAGDHCIHQLLDTFADIGRAVTDGLGNGVPVACSNITRLALFSCNVLREILHDPGPGQDGRNIIKRGEAWL